MLACGAQKADDRIHFPRKMVETEAVAVMLACREHGLPLSCITAAQSGATAPATLAGFLAQSLAETLGSLIMVNVFKPGDPMVFSNWPLVIGLRTAPLSAAARFRC